jgi:HTH-type transcriptional regulator/antitoxin HipB
MVCKLEIQPETCMTDFTIRTAEQLPILLQAFRKQAGLTQSAVAMRLGITQQTLSALERNAEKVSADRLLALLSILGVELVLRQGSESPAPKPPMGPNW